MQNEIIESNRNQPNAQTHSKFAPSPAISPGQTPTRITDSRGDPSNGLPLPKGEGRGEGEGAVQTPATSVTANGSEHPKFIPFPDSPIPSPNGFPLPEGEGQGEGEGAVQTPRTPATANGSDHRKFIRFPDSPTRNGKIARLPDDLREQVNHMLRVGLRYIDIIASLKAQGCSDINEVNLSKWKHGGYLDWLEREQAEEARAAIPNAIEHCTHALSIDRLHQNLVALACDQLTRVMLKFDADRALEALYEKPQLFPAFIGAVAALGRCTADLAKAFDLAQNSHSKLRDQVQSSVGQQNLTPGHPTECTPRGGGYPQ